MTDLRSEQRLESEISQMETAIATPLVTSPMWSLWLFTERWTFYGVSNWCLRLRRCDCRLGTAYRMQYIHSCYLLLKAVLSDAPRNPAQRSVPDAYAATAARAQQSTTRDIPISQGGHSTLSVDRPSPYSSRVWRVLRLVCQTSLTAAAELETKLSREESSRL